MPQKYRQSITAALKKYYNYKKYMLRKID